MAKKKKALPTWSAVAIPDIDKMDIGEFAEALVSAFNALDQLGYSPAERIAVPKKGMVIVGVRNLPQEETFLDDKSFSASLMDKAADGLERGLTADKAVDAVLSGRVVYNGKEATVQEYTRAVKELNKFLKAYKKECPEDTDTLALGTALLKAITEKIRLSVQ